MEKLAFKMGLGVGEKVSSEHVSREKYQQILYKIYKNVI